MSSDQIDKSRLRLIPELAFFDSVTAADESWLNAKTVRPLWKLWPLVAGVAAVFGLAWIAICWFFEWPQWVEMIVVPVCLSSVNSAVASCLGHYFWREPMRRVVRENLQAAGIPVCLTCGYDLRGQEIARCPECGEPFDEKLLHAKTAHPEPAQRED